MAGTDLLRIYHDEPQRMPIDLYEWLHPGYLIGGKYPYVAPIAHGRIGLILKIRDDEAGEFALKTVRPKTRRLSSPGELELLEESLAMEFRLMSRFHHENIIAAHEILQDPKLGACIVMEYAPGGDLRQRIEDRVMTHEESLFVFERLVDVLCVLHRPGADGACGIVHLDLESKNVVFDRSGIPKLCDFHYAREIRREESVRDLPPEPAAEIDVRTDLYQLGRLLYEMLSYGSPDPERLGMIPDRMRPLVARLLVRDSACQYADIQQVRLAYRALDAEQWAAQWGPPPEPHR